MSRKRFVSAADRKTIHADWWEANETVTIKKLSWGEKKRLMGEAASFAPIKVGGESKREALVEKKSDEMSVTLRPDTMQTLTMELGIVSWTFTDDAGNPVPVNPNTIAQLEEEDGDYILSELDKLNAAMTPEQRAEFRPSN